jgi:hypothetical protein
VQTGLIKPDVNDAQYSPHMMTYLGMSSDWNIHNNLMGAFGIDAGSNMHYNVHENGNAVAWFAGEAFRSFLVFMKEIKDTGKLNAFDTTLLIRPGSNVIDMGQHMRYSNPCWWNVSTRNIFGEHGLFERQLNDHARSGSASLLLAPPEIGFFGQQGASALYQPGMVHLSSPYYISADVSDEKLARILQIFDAISFDPEWHVMTHYGFAGEDFSWSGIPYESGIIKSPESREHTGVFITHIIDGAAGKAVYRIPNETIYRYATGTGAKAMLQKSYKTDPNLEMDEARKELEGQFPYWTMFSVASVFYSDVMKGTKNTGNDWDAYINELSDLGLIEWNEYYNSLPVTNP